MLREVLGVRESDSRDTILERLGSRQILGLTLGLDVAGELHPLAAVERLRVAWRDLLGELVADRPTVVVVEDLHWAQADLLDLLEFLLDGVAGPLLLVGTGRPELLTSRPSWGRRRDASTVWLEPLAREDAARLVVQAPEHVREAVLEKAEGNPFFIEELVAQVRAGAAATAIPDSVQAVLAARIDRLPPLEKHALQAAAVVGRAFWREPVRELLGDALPSFELLEERDFIRPRTRSSFEGMRELVFKHALTREVAYGSLPQARRLRLHASVARWLEGFGGGRDEHAALLAHHYAEAVRSDGADLAWQGADAEYAALRRNAISWLRRAAELAIGRYEIDEGIALLRRALSLENEDSTRCELRIAVARASALKFDGEAFWTEMETALSLAGDDSTRAEICSRLAVESLRSRRHVDTNSGAGSSRTVGRVRAPARAAGNGVARTRADREGMPGHRRRAMQPQRPRRSPSGSTIPSCACTPGMPAPPSRWPRPNTRRRGSGERGVWSCLSGSATPTCERSSAKHRMLRASLPVDSTRPARSPV